MGERVGRGEGERMEGGSVHVQGCEREQCEMIRSRVSFRGGGGGGLVCRYRIQSRLPCIKENMYRQIHSQLKEAD